MGGGRRRRERSAPRHGSAGRRDHRRSTALPALPRPAPSAPGLGSSQTQRSGSQGRREGRGREATDERKRTCSFGADDGSVRASRLLSVVSPHFSPLFCRLVSLPHSPPVPPSNPQWPSASPPWPGWLPRPPPAPWRAARRAAQSPRLLPVRVGFWQGVAFCSACVMSACGKKGDQAFFNPNPFSFSSQPPPAPSSPLTPPREPSAPTPRPSWRAAWRTCRGRWP